MNADEERDIERRKNNVILYRVMPEIQSEVADDRKAGDMAFFYEICEQGCERTNIKKTVLKFRNSERSSKYDNIE